MQEDGGVVNKFGVWDFISIDKKAVGHQWVPVVEVAELQSNAVAVLETRVEQQRGIELQLQQVTTQMLHVLFDYDVDYLPWRTETKSSPDVMHVHV